MRWFVIGILVAACANTVSAQSQGTLQVEVRSDTGPVRDAEVVVNGKTYETDAQSAVAVAVPPGRVELVVVKSGFAPASA